MTRILDKLSWVLAALVSMALAAFAAAVFAENIDLFNDSQYAWSENAGRLNAEPACRMSCRRGTQMRTNLDGLFTLMA